MAEIERRSFLVMIAGLTVIAVPAGSGDAEAEPPALGRRVALRGYDPVAYFTLGRPKKGDDAFWFAFDDAIYHFKTAEHRAKFVADPERYAPQYAGF